MSKKIIYKGEIYSVSPIYPEGSGRLDVAMDLLTGEKKFYCAADITSAYIADWLGAHTEAFSFTGR